MDKSNIVKKLQEQYPDTQIFMDNEENPKEILCEVDPSNEHPEYSVAVAVADSIKKHVHKVSVEEYEILSGELVLIKDNERFVLRQGDRLTIYPGEVHEAQGDETWIKVTSRPGWTKEDHIIL